MNNEHDLGDEFVQRRAVRVGAAAQAAARGETGQQELDTPKVDGSDASLSDRVRSGGDPFDAEKNILPEVPLEQQRPTKLGDGSLPEQPPKRGGTFPFSGRDNSYSDAVRSGYESVPAAPDARGAVESGLQARTDAIKTAWAGGGGAATWVSEKLGIKLKDTDRRAIDAVFEAVNLSDITGDTAKRLLEQQGVDRETASNVGMLVSMAASVVGMKADVGPKLAKYALMGPSATMGRGVHAAESVFKATSPEEFIQARNQSKRLGFLSPLSPEDMAGYKIMLSTDGRVGYSISPTGDLQNVFNNSTTKGAGQAAVVDAVRNGAQSLDAFDGFLPNYYSRFGFSEVDRAKFDPQYAPKGWDYEKYGMPDVVFMRRGDAVNETPSIAEKVAAGAVLDGEASLRIESDALSRAEKIRALLGKRTLEGGTVTQQALPTDPAELEKMTSNSTILNDLGSLGAAIVWRGANKDAFVNEMVKTVGEGVRPVLDRVWDEKVPAALTKLVETVARGKNLPSTEYLLELFARGKHGMEWYGNARSELQTIFGDKWELVADLIAATSPSNSVKENLKKTFTILQDWVLGGVDRVMERLHPEDIHRKFVEQAVTGQPITGPKIGPFASAIKGDPNAVVLDIWMMRAFGFSADSPNDAQRIFMTKIIHDESTRLGVEPRQYQAALWVAQKIKTEGLDTVVSDLDVMVKQVLRERPQLLEKFGLSVADLGNNAGTAITNMVLARLALDAANGDNPEEGINNTLMAAGMAGGLTPSATRKLAGMLNKMRGALTKLVRPVMIKAGTRAELEKLTRDGQSAIQAGDKAIQINWAAIREPQQIDDLVQSVIEARGLGSGAKTKSTVPELRELARNLNMDPVIFLARNPEMGNLRSDEVLAVKDMIVASRNRLRSLAADHLADPANAVLQDAFAQHYGIHAALIQRFEDSASDIGRAMRMLQEASGTIGRDVRTVANIEDLRAKGLIDGVKTGGASAGPSGSTTPLRTDPLSKLNDLVTQATNGDITEIKDVANATTEQQKLVADLVRSSYPDMMSRVSDNPLTDLMALVEKAREGDAAPLKPGRDLVRGMENSPMQRLADQAQDPAEWAKRFDKTAGPSAQAKAVAKIIDTKTVAQMLIAIKDPEVVVKGFLEKGFDAVTEVWINALLSNIQGHMANIMSNSIVAAVAPLERGIAGISGYVRGAAGDSDRVFVGEMGAMYAGMIHGFVDAVTGAVKTMRTGVSSFSTKEVRTGAVQELLGAAHNTTLGRVTEYLATMPSRGMLAEDEFFKVINERAELWAQAYRSAMRSGERSPSGIKSAIEGFLANPPKTVKEAARSFAETQTFSQDLPQGLAGLQHFASQPAVKYLVPFFKTPTNIFLYNLERFPGLNLALSDIRSNILKPTAEGDLARAKFAMGSMAVATAWYLAQAGIITGRGPSDPNLNAEWKADKNQPYSAVYQDGTQRGFNRLDAYGSLFGIVADFQQISGELQADEMDEVALALSVAFSNNFLSKTYVQGLSEALESLMKPDQGNKSNFWRKLGGSVVPAAVGGVERVVDPAMSDVQSLRDEIYSKIPGFSKYVPPRRYINGEKRMVPPMWGLDIASPIPTSKKANDPRWREMLDMKVAAQMPPRAVAGPASKDMGPEKAFGGVKLDGWQYDRFVQLAGSEFKLPAGVVEQVASAWGVKNPPQESQGMWDMMGLLVASPFFARLKSQASGPESEAARQIKRLINTYQNLAENYIIHGPHTPEDAKLFGDVKEKYLEKQLDRIQVRSGSSARVTAEGVVNELIKGINR